MKTYAMMILGCKVNDYEAHALKEKMDVDYKEVSFKEKADIYIIFSCCVTNVAESKTRKFIHQCKRNNPDAYVCVVGCYAQTNDAHEVFDEVDLIIGSKYKDKIKDYIDRDLKANKVEDLEDVEFEYLSLHEYKDKTRAFLKVQDGCNQFCSYCIIPYARGHERSAKLEDVVAEAKTLVKTTKEIVLTGIHTGRYFDGEHHLIDLLKALLEIDGLETIRLSSIEVTEVTDEIIDLMASTDRIAPHLHIPLQAGSNTILEAMNRPYNVKEFEERIAYIRKKVPSVSISTDLIVAFPNESDELFNETLETLKRIRFNFIHVFPYSRKHGTKADKMSGHFNNDIKKARVKAVMDLEARISAEIEDTYVGKTVKVLVERNDGTNSFGHSKEYLLVEIKGVVESNELIEVEIISADKGRIIGVRK